MSVSVICDSLKKGLFSFSIQSLSGSKFLIDGINIYFVVSPTAQGFIIQIQLLSNSQSGQEDIVSANITAEIAILWFVVQISVFESLVSTFFTFRSVVLKLPFNGIRWASAWGNG